LKQLEILSAKQEYYKKREDILERINKTAFKIEICSRFARGRED